MEWVKSRAAQNSLTASLPRAILTFVAIRGAVLLVLVAISELKNRSAYSVLVRWDSQWYSRIADHGYGHIVATSDGRQLSDYAFFPLYPATERIFHFVTQISTVNCGLFISAIASIFAAAGIYRSVHLVSGEQTAFITTMLWALVPIGIVESMAYTESLFTALAAWAIFYILKKNWVAAAALAVGAGLTRPIGIAVVAAVVVCALYEQKRPYLAIAIAPIGLVGYLSLVGYQQKNLLGYFDVATGWQNGFDGGANFLQWIWKLLTSGSAFSAILILFGIGTLILLLRSSIKDRQPLALLVYSSSILLLSFTTASYFGSKPRYLLPAFGLLIPIAARTAKLKLGTQIVIFSLSLICSAVYGAFWLLGAGPP
jgi:Gpi18-like mannosyltransferase